MSVKYAAIHYCERCGASHTCFNKYGTYEVIPEDWLEISNYGELCGSCAKDFRKFVTDFFGDEVPKEWDYYRY